MPFHFFFLFGQSALTAIMRLALCKKAGKAQKLLLLLVVEMTALKTEKRGTTRAECSKHTEWQQLCLKGILKTAAWKALVIMHFFFFPPIFWHQYGNNTYLLTRAHFVNTSRIHSDNTPDLGQRMNTRLLLWIFQIQLRIISWKLKKNV